MKNIETFCRTYVRSGEHAGVLKNIHTHLLENIQIFWRKYRPSKSIRTFWGTYRYSGENADLLKA
jgi:hypothetical protein